VYVPYPESSPERDPASLSFRQNPSLCLPTSPVPLGRKVNSHVQAYWHSLRGGFVRVHHPHHRPGYPHLPRRSNPYVSFYSRALPVSIPCSSDLSSHRRKQRSSIFPYVAQFNVLRCYRAFYLADRVQSGSFHRVSLKEPRMVKVEDGRSSLVSFLPGP
jgi:hypothetical protein